MANQNDDNKMSREEAGRMGGEATSDSHGKEFYEEIGSKGGQNSNSGGQNSSNNSRNNSNDGKMSKEEAGRKGGENSNGGNS
ncbi:KGG domain-containing protein [Planococcus sp. 107-1]|uniref:KGG domain-containing protein n=1 Tax=Planococcus sp. 107-1 TaxID=2908840 RepID=UPI001F40C1D7|nr:KGG domain-containing protein [Planococcus sp. 107-1]UJF25643.1 glucose starvation-inducible protein B [Planococcus sp. 107-1]